MLLMEVEHNLNCKVILIIIHTKRVGSIEARSDQEFGTISEELVAGREGSQLGRVLSKCMCIAVLSQHPTLIYELDIYIYAFGKSNFLPAAIPPCAMILLDLRNLKRAGLSQNLDKNWQ